MRCMKWKTSQKLLGLVVVLTMHLVGTSELPGPECPKKCGSVDIPYPFGIGENCAMEGFNLNCNNQADNGVDKPFIYNVEVLSISVPQGHFRINNIISTSCYNTNTKKVDYNDWYLNFLSSPFRFSDVHNKFTVIGCSTLAYLVEDDDNELYLSGCGSKCQSLTGLTNGSCSGNGCCQTDIPKNMQYYYVWFNPNYNTSEIWKFSQCSYAVLLEADLFNFNTTYLTTTAFNSTDKGNAPVVLDWAIGNETCEKAGLDKTSYACISDNSGCVNSTNGPGYLCNCSQGYQGNPYIRDRHNGCQDIDECIQPSPCPEGATCHNIPGSYECSCPVAKKYFVETKTCNLDINFIIGTAIGTVVLILICVCIYIILENRKLVEIKKKYFEDHGGLLLLEEMRLQQGLAFTIFKEAELQLATNNFDESKVLGKGGHATVYKGILQDNTSVAIKRCMSVDERNKKEFSKEMLILSQINHKNIVKLLGCCLEVEVPMLVYEYMPNGNLFQLIHDKNAESRALFSTLLRIAHEAAEGLAFLHSYATPPIFHGDVKPSNILLDENYTAKVSDFGASILAPTDEAQFVTLIQGTCGYLDPEYMQTCQLTDKSDVYSFGVVLLEILTGRTAFTLKESEQNRSLSSTFLFALKEKKVESILDEQAKNEMSMELLEEVVELAEQCLEMCGDKRPTMKEVAEKLGGLRKLFHHPWVPQDSEMKSLLDGSSTTSFDIDVSTGHPSFKNSAKLHMVDPNTSFIAR